MKEMEKSKMAVWGGLTNSCKRREAKSKGEKERYKHLNAEFQRRSEEHTSELQSLSAVMAVWGGLTNSCEKKRSKKQRRKEKI